MDKTYLFTLLLCSSINALAANYEPYIYEKTHASDTSYNIRNHELQNPTTDHYISQLTGPPRNYPTTDNYYDPEGLSVSSDELATKVRGALQRNLALSTEAQNLQVLADDRGNITLVGTVLTNAENAKVQNIARSVYGVRSVSSKVFIMRP